MRIFGKILQYVGLTLPPLAIVLELTRVLGRDFGLSQMLLMMIFSFVAFQVGRQFEGYALSAKQ